jgi:ATP-dependent Zn protease
VGVGARRVRALFQAAKKKVMPFSFLKTWQRLPSENNKKVKR